MNQVDAIFCADLHLRESIPICRKDENFIDIQFKKLQFLSKLQKKYDCPVYCAADLLDNWKPSPWLISMILKYLPNNFWTIYGNHELPNHSLKLKRKSGIYTLYKGRGLKILKGFHYGQTPSKGEYTVKIKNRKVIIWHVMTYQKLPFPGCTDLSAKKLLRKYKHADVILTGDNHQSFVEEFNGRILVNPGSMMRQDADQIDYKPAFFLYNAKTNTVKRKYIPIEKGVVSREHLEEVQERDERLNAFISSLDTSFLTGTHFEKNLKIFNKKNKTKKAVKKYIDWAISD